MLALFGLCAGRAFTETIVNPLITIPRTSSPPTIDGKLSEGEWTSAAFIPYFVTVGGESPDQPTTARICYTDRAIYLSIVCHEDLMSKLVAEEQEHDGIVWRDDCVELFIQPGSDLPYYHIAINALGTIYDASYAKILEPDTSWNPALKVAASKRADSWFVEMEIPINAFGVEFVIPDQVRDGDAWRVNVCRERKPWVENSSWSLLLFGESTFRDPERFGTMVFGDETVPLVDVTQFVGLPNGIVRRSGQVRNPSGQPVNISLNTLIVGGKSKPIARPMTIDAVEPLAFDLVDSIADEGTLTAVLECSVAGKTVYRAVRPFYVPPVRARLRDLTARLESVEASVAGLPEDSALARSVRSLRVEVDLVASVIPVAYRTAPERVGEIIRTLDQIERGILTARVAFEMDSKGGQSPAFVIWATDPWVQLKPGDLPPQGRLPSEARAIAYRGERAYAAVNITNLSGHTLDLRIIPGPFARKGGEVPPGQVELHTCAFVPEEAGSSDLIGDALPGADSAGREVVPPSETRQAFLVIRTDGLEAGEYSGSVKVAPTTGGPAQEVRVRITVYPLDLPDEPKPWICTWGGLLSMPWTRPSSRAYFEDALDRGVNVFLMNPASVAPKLDKNGDFKPIDYSSLDRQFREHEGTSFAVGAYNISIQFGGWAKDAGIEYMSPAYRKAFIAWIRDWVRHLKSLGLSYDDFAFELVDEPAPEGSLRVHIDTGKLMREADPKARIVTTTNFIEMDKLERISPYVDIWVPQGRVLEDAAAREFMKRTGKEMWMYACAGDSKRLSPVTYYRILPWQAFRYDLQGWGFFAHMWPGEDPWESTNNRGKYLGTYSTIYPGVNGPVTSRRWECYFKGHEDFRALHLLKSLVTRGEKAGLNVSEARLVLKEALNGSAGLQEMKKNNRTAAEESAFLTDIRRKVAEVSIKLSDVLASMEHR